MNCLIAAATSFEISPFLDYYRKPDQNFGIEEIDVLITGIGLVATSYSLQKQLTLKSPDLIIQAGIAGGFESKMALGTVVTIASDLIADQGVMEASQFNNIFDMKFHGPDEFPYENGRLINPNGILLEKTRLESVSAISVNQITSSAEMVAVYEKKYHPVVESMEGASLHYVCLMEKIPFLQVRSISNHVGERDKSKWKLKESIENLNKELIALLENF